MGRIRSVSLRASRGIGWRLTQAGTRISAKGVVEGELEPRGDSIDASMLLRNGWKAPSIDVLWYFSDTSAKLYQIQQWLPVIAAHSGDISFGIVTRTRSAWTELMRQDLPAPSFLAVGFPSLMDLYRVLEPKAIIYPNNGQRNFQSLIWAEAVHIHVNHGESDKVSMVSNQAKAYDRVFVAGEAAVRRHRAALVDFDEFRLIRVGRPQLDLDPEPSLPPSTRRTLLYAPTWEGEDEMNNFSSLDKYGVAIIEALLAQSDARVIYKPHPRVAMSTQPVGRVGAHPHRRAPVRGGRRGSEGRSRVPAWRGHPGAVPPRRSAGLRHLQRRAGLPLLPGRGPDRPHRPAQRPGGAAARGAHRRRHPRAGRLDDRQRPGRRGQPADRRPLRRAPPGASPFLLR